MRTCLTIILLLGALPPWPLPAAAKTGAAECPHSAAAESAPTPLRHVAAALKTSARLDVLAVGSGGIMGLPGDPASALPHRMARALRSAVPGTDVHVLVRGGRGATAVETLATLRHEIAAHRFGLVLWQTGTVDALRGAPPDSFRQVLAQGAQAVRDQGGDLVLIDPQFSRVVHDHADLAPYERALRDVAAEPGVSLFDRFELSRAWVVSGAIDPEKATGAERPRVADQLQACLAMALADVVIRGAQSAAP